MSPAAGGDGIALYCPAKINLRLRVGPAQAELGARHRLDTIYSAVGIWDRVELRRTEPGNGFRLSLEGDHLGDLNRRDADLRANLAVKALLAMAQATGHQPDVAIHILKRIPVGAGLAGGSADAAGTMLGLNRLWNLGMAAAELDRIAAGLGADLPFCLHGGLSRGTGFGQILEPLDPDGLQAQRLSRAGLTGHLLIGAYEDQLSTAHVYKAFDLIGPGPNDLNDLQETACTLHPRSRQALDLARQAGIGPAFVSGSGPSVVVMAPHPEQAIALIRLWREQNAVDRIIEADSPVLPRMVPLRVTHGQ
ncbi:4-(cytidine 5'-diphospho)-2-C-methyl-D-erythritol kinase [Bifidobacterium sp. W8109]|uniref:4-(cytidine 5'-diphospho)-2-C-methyl-D-erythritol kinase n=1 Tax=Bifidobacterium TaxID=1678 RepID=UPI0018DC9897|nr:MULTISPECIES: 4-(cytidine 5'-diphospho)-2-C-methyl-D-erythritol kinase [Bifidobacterium]MBH9972316.1 4-(cytidine 5'-diphospho)-2-C-methyl-D-erythritol kinase [Bifidobacterium asteroides]MBI0073962.1 4-(cytidine 5'-diphospho)-2-C-methyl-D-erythritol kinase [Bifidobacterium sp. W8110]